MPGVFVRLLGPVDVMVHGEARAVSGLRRKAVLAMLGVHLDTVVSTERLIDVVWDSQAPTTVRNALQGTISQLRAVLGDRDAIVSRKPGYLLSGAQTDVKVAESLVDEALRQEDPAVRLRRLGDAVALWRGDSLHDVAVLPGLKPQAQWLESLRLRTIHLLVDTRLALGHHEQLVPELTQLAARHPLDERLHRQLILALYRIGQQVEALAVARRMRAELSDALGVDPSPELQDLETAVLRHDPSLAGPTTTGPTTRVSASGPGVRVPAQLPAAVAGFAGRAAELATMDSLLDDAARQRTSPVVTVIGGAGVGKTALAVHWAHRVAARFPDGQLYANLRGFDPGASVMDPAEAVRGFLDALGVPAGRVPEGLDAQASLYRGMIAGRRILVVIDNVRDPEQARPLLPGAPGCLAVVTSRDQLSPLVAAEGAWPLPLELLTHPEAHEMLSLRLGTARVAAEPAAVEEIITRCAGLPLALGIAAARAALRRQVPLATLAEQLRGQDRLDTLNAGDAGSDVRHVFSWSYRTLSPAAARLFRLLGVFPGPEVGLGAAASLTGLPRPQARALLTELDRANLITERSPSRYVLHDLLRAYAAELAREQESGPALRAARGRLIEYCLHTTQVAARMLQGTWCDLPLPPPITGAAPERLDDVEAASAWFDTELTMLVAAVSDAADGFEGQCWRLAWSLSSLLDTRARQAEYQATQQVALAAAERVGDRAGEAYAHQCIGRAHARENRIEEGVAHLELALDYFASVGDEAGQGSVLIGLGFAAHSKGDEAEAARYARRALTLFRSVGHQAGQALALNNLGWSLTELGEHDEALRHCEESVRLRQELGELHPLAGSWDSLGHLHDRLGHHSKAIECYRSSLALYRQTGERYDQAVTQSRMADAQAASGDLAGAIESWRQSLAVLDAFDDAMAEEVRYKLRRSTMGR